MKKNFLLALAIGLTAVFALPAVTQAAELTDAEETPLKIGAEITATSANLTSIMEGGDTLECKLVTLHGNVLENGPQHVTIGEISVTTQECSLKNKGGVVFVTTPAMGSITLAAGEGVSTMTYKFDHPATSLFECHLHGPLGLFYEAKTDILSIGASFLTGGGGSAPCPKLGLVSADFTLENQLGAVTID